MYDGTFVKQQSATLSQRIEGFYDPASVPGRITYIAGSAQSNLRRDAASGHRRRSRHGTSRRLRSVQRCRRETRGTTSRDRRPRSRDSRKVERVSRHVHRASNDRAARRSGQRLPGNGRDDLSDAGQRRRCRRPARQVGVIRRSAVGSQGRRASAFQEHGRGPGRQGCLHRSRRDAGARAHDLRLRQLPAATVAPFSDRRVRPQPHADAGRPADAGRRIRRARNIRLHFDVGNPATYHALSPPNLPPGDPNPFASLAADDYIIGAGGRSGSDPTLARGGELCRKRRASRRPRLSIASSRSFRAP